MATPERPTGVGPGSPPGYRPLPTSGQRHDVARTRNLKVGLFSISAVSLVVFSMIWNPPTGRVHSFTEASNYSERRENGCTNSGDGCHGEETAYTDFNDYHPNATCTTCHEYQGVGCIPCHSPKGHECQSCHDGTMPEAGDRDKITDPYPKGHYRETTHTATGTDITAVVKISTDGSAEAQCRDCHERDLAGAHTEVGVPEGSEYGDSVGCVECHNDTRNSGLELVLSDWPERRCEDCHTEGGSAPMHATDIVEEVASKGGLGCGRTGPGCHASTDVHGLHADAPEDCSGSAADGEPGCHDLDRQAALPTVTACGDGAGKTCHAPYVNDTFSHDDDLTVHSVDSVSAGADSRFSETPCSACHDMEPDGTSLVSEHQRSSSALAGARPDICRACHNAGTTAVKAVVSGWKERDGDEPCTACHDSGLLDDRHTDLESSHRGRTLDAQGAVDRGACVAAGCHATDDLRTLHTDAGGCTTQGCHTASGDIRGANLTSCGGGDPAAACHADIHGGAEGLDGDDPAHVAGGAQAFSVLVDEATGTEIACSACHSMMLGSEHERANSLIATGPGTICARCHTAPSAAPVIAAGWPTRSKDTACAACHGAQGVTARHTGLTTSHRGRTLNAAGTAEPAACVAAGCHATDDLRALHTGTGGCTTRGCHTATGDIRGANQTSCGGSDPDVACHTGIHAGVDGDDASYHTAGAAQASSTLADEATGLEMACTTCHSMMLSSEHERASASMSAGSGTVCSRCHTSSAGAPVVAANWPARPSVSACAACHTTARIDFRHTNLGEKHRATELAPSGAAAPDSCATAGCHGSSDVRVLHADRGCTIRGCHQNAGDILGNRRMSCGGSSASQSCHRTFSPEYHRQSHAADLEGTVNGIPYLPGENVGCFGCHLPDLVAEHDQRYLSNRMEGGGASVCRVCHAGAETSENGAYATIRPVIDAIAAGDRRCVACHRSGSDSDGPSGVASPHKAISNQTTQPVGAVWSDPADDWREALDSVTGGGHNALPAQVVGAAADKSFPLTEFTIEDTAYGWALPSNTNPATAWLRTTPLTPANPSEGPADPRLYPEATTTVGIRTSMVTCDDCHVLSDDMTGPHGSAVRIAMDPQYSQTEYANPTPGTFQFDPYNVDNRNADNPEGYKPVICVKCHLVYARSREGTTAVYVGGNGLHSTHASRHAMPSAGGRTEVCIDCHVRIPHAWKRPRLLLRTVEAQGIEPDGEPYVAPGHTGLVGIKLVDLGTTGINRRDCATGGCYATPTRSETPTNHPTPDLLPGQKYWP